MRGGTKTPNYVSYDEFEERISNNRRQWTKDKNAGLYIRRGKKDIIIFVRMVGIKESVMRKVSL